MQGINGRSVVITGSDNVYNPSDVPQSKGVSAPTGVPKNDSREDPLGKSDDLQAEKQAGRSLLDIPQNGVLQKSFSSGGNPIGKINLGGNEESVIGNLQSLEKSPSLAEQLPKTLEGAVDGLLQLLVNDAQYKDLRPEGIDFSIQFFSQVINLVNLAQKEVDKDQGVDLRQVLNRALLKKFGGELQMTKYFYDLLELADIDNTVNNKLYINCPFTTNIRSLQDVLSVMVKNSPAEKVVTDNVLFMKKELLQDRYEDKKLTNAVSDLLRDLGLHGGYKKSGDAELDDKFSDYNSTINKHGGNVTDNYQMKLNCQNLIESFKLAKEERNFLQRLADWLVSRFSKYSYAERNLPNFVDNILSQPKEDLVDLDIRSYYKDLIKYKDGDGVAKIDSAIKELLKAILNNSDLHLADDKVDRLAGQLLDVLKSSVHPAA